LKQQFPPVVELRPASDLLGQAEVEDLHAAAYFLIVVIWLLTICRRP
jgi:hypothetical protein